MGKTFLGISYILQGIPYINLLGSILVPIAWVAEGFKERKGLWVGTGISGIISFGLITAGLIGIVRALHLIQALEHAGMGINSLPTSTLPEDILNAIHGGNPVLLSSLLVMAAGVLLGIIYFILMLVSIFQAGSMYSSNTIKVGGILYVIDVVIAGLIIALAASRFATHPVPPHSPELLISLGAIYIASLIAGLLALTASIIIGIGFLIIHEEPKAQT